MTEVNRVQLAEAIGLRADKITMYHKQGVLDPAVTGKKGRGFIYNLEEALDLLHAHRDTTKDRKSEPIREAQQVISARARKLQAEATLAELNLRKRQSELIEVSQVEKETFELSRLTRDRILQVADRVSPLVAAERDANKCFQLIQTELIEALSLLSE